MTQTEINRAVALATGESVRTVSELGFSLADPDVVEHYSEPCDLEDMIADWDQIQVARNQASLVLSRTVPRRLAGHV